MSSSGGSFAREGHHERVLDARQSLQDLGELPQAIVALAVVEVAVGAEQQLRLDLAEAIEERRAARNPESRRTRSPRYWRRPACRSRSRAGWAGSRRCGHLRERRGRERPARDERPRRKAARGRGVGSSRPHRRRPLPHPRRGGAAGSRRSRSRASGTSGRRASGARPRGSGRRGFRRGPHRRTRATARIAPSRESTSRRAPRSRRARLPIFPGGSHERREVGLRDALLRGLPEGLFHAPAEATREPLLHPPDRIGCGGGFGAAGLAPLGPAGAAATAGLPSRRRAIGAILVSHRGRALLDRVIPRRLPVAQNSGVPIVIAAAIIGASIVGGSF